MSAENSTTKRRDVGPDDAPGDAGLLGRRHDLRLFGAAGGMWLASLAALFGSVAAAVWIAIAAVVGATGLGLATRRSALSAQREVDTGHSAGRHRSRRRAVGLGTEG